RGRGTAVLGPGRRVMCPQHVGVPTAGRAVVGTGKLLAVGTGLLTQPVGRVATGGRHRRMTTSITRVRTTHGTGRARPGEATVHLTTVGRGWVLRWWAGVAGCGVGKAVGVGVVGGTVVGSAVVGRALEVAAVKTLVGVGHRSEERRVGAGGTAVGGRGGGQGWMYGVHGQGVR